MLDVDVLTATAPSLDKLKRELARLLEGYGGDDIVAISHAANVGAIKRSGGVWGPATQTSRVEYSAVVLVRDK